MDRRIDIGNKSYRLRYSVNAMCEVECAAGCPLERLAERQYTAARLLLWGALLGDAPDMTLRAAGQLADEYMRGGGTVEELVDMCAKAMEDAGFFARAPIPEGAQAGNR